MPNAVDLFRLSLPGGVSGLRSGANVLNACGRGRADLARKIVRMFWGVMSLEQSDRVIEATLRALYLFRPEKPGDGLQSTRPGEEIDSLPANSDGARNVILRTILDAGLSFYAAVDTLVMVDHLLKSSRLADGGDGGVVL